MQRHNLVRAFAAVILGAASLVPLGAHAVLIGTLEQLSPLPTTYTFGTDFKTFSDNGLAATGDVTALVQPVDAGSANSGCEAADFAGFTAGNIALVQRGTCLFSLKANNAAAAGALGILIFDSAAGTFPGVQMAELTTIPALFLTHALGIELLQITGQLEMHMTVTRVPEPGTFLLLGIALVTLAALRIPARSLASRRRC